VDGWIEVTSVADVPDGTMTMVEVSDHEILVANAGGTFFVADNRCPHLGGHLAEGVLEGSVVTCPRHHSQFDLTDGRVVRWTDWQGATLTVTELIKHPRPLRVYEARVEDGTVFMGPEKPPAVG
jgi:3-phenylpropionate/trans-cinnamate dioxygenase ferredoxin subunit